MVVPTKRGGKWQQQQKNGAEAEQKNNKKKHIWGMREELRVRETTLQRYLYAVRV